MNCYYCGKPKTSYEHVPPKCIFFENTDGSINRNGLITVPSCEEHNSEKQKDDEYFRFLLVMSIHSSGVHGTLNIDKFFRALNRTPHVFSSFIINPQQVFVKHESQIEYKPTIIYEPDIPRYHKIIKQICIGLFFHTYGTVFSGHIDIAYDGTMSLSDQMINDNQKELINTINILGKGIPFLGKNEDIFKYKLIDNCNKVYLLLVFYQTNEMIIRMTRT
jgi:hypothetical protein